MDRKPPAPAPKPATKHQAPHPARNLGGHLKKPASGEYVTNHHRGAKKR